MLRSFGKAGVLLAFGCSLWSGATGVAQTGMSAGDEGSSDKYLWLEDAHGDRAMDWVKAENARSAKVLEADPHYAGYFAEALKLAEDPNRLALPSLVGGEIYSQWRDAANPRGCCARPAWRII